MSVRQSNQQPRSCPECVNDSPACSQHQALGDPARDHAYANTYPLTRQISLSIIFVSISYHAVKIRWASSLCFIDTSVSESACVLLHHPNVYRKGGNLIQRPYLSLGSYYPLLSPSPSEHVIFPHRENAHRGRHHPAEARQTSSWRRDSVGVNLIKGNFRRKTEFECQIAAFNAPTKGRTWFLWRDDTLYAWK